MSRPSPLWIHGIDGRMGNVLQTAVSEDSHFTLVGGSSRAGSFLTEKSHLAPSMLPMEKLWKDRTVVLDFSSAEGTKALVRALEKDSKGVRAILVASTGLDDSIRKSLGELASIKKLGILEAPNTSLGVLALSLVADKVAAALAPLGFDIEVVETHHRHKKDAPSGTALLLAKRLATALGFVMTEARRGERKAKEIGLASIRGGGVIGEHEVRFLGDYEEVTLSHRAYSRELFAKGALTLARWLEGKNAGYYTLEDVKLEDLSSL